MRDDLEVRQDTELDRLVALMARLRGPGGCPWDADQTHESLVRYQPRQDDIVLEAGVLLGLAYAATRSLWLPIGLHFGWNFTEGGIFGASVSGRAYHGMFKFSLSGSDILTGGAFGLALQRSDVVRHGRRFIFRKGAPR